MARAPADLPGTEPAAASPSICSLGFRHTRAAARVLFGPAGTRAAFRVLIGAGLHWASFRLLCFANRDDAFSLTLEVMSGFTFGTSSADGTLATLLADCAAPPAPGRDRSTARARDASARDLVSAPGCAHSSQSRHGVRTHLPGEALRSNGTPFEA